jgi:phage FluMu gp28-like protein
MHCRQESAELTNTATHSMLALARYTHCVKDYQGVMFVNSIPRTLQLNVQHRCAAQHATRMCSLGMQWHDQK